VAEGNGYGHPAPGTLEALRSAGARVFRTDRHGTVKVLVGPEGARVETER
jgi:competence protein ComEC